MQYPIRAASVLMAMVAVSAITVAARAQDAHVSEAALTMPRAQDHTLTDAIPRVEKKHKPPHRAARSTKPREELRRQSAAAVPRSTFEDRSTHYFDPLSLTLAPDSRLDPANTQYNQVTGKFDAADSQTVARTPDDSVNPGASSASIENMGQGHNVTVVVPLFQILNSISPGPPQ